MNNFETYKPKEWPKEENKILEKEIGIFKTICFISIVVTVAMALGYAVSMLPFIDGNCEVEINESFINGTSMGTEYAIAMITNEIVQCKTLPISYAGYNYTLIAVECLNLNNTEEK